MMQGKPFLSPAEIAAELSISSATVMRLIHRGELPAIRISERIYRVPAATFEMYTAGTIRTAAPAALRTVKRQPALGRGEAIPEVRGAATAAR